MVAILEKVSNRHNENKAHNTLLPTHSTPVRGKPPNRPSRSDHPGLLSSSKSIRHQILSEAVRDTAREISEQDFDTKFSGSTLVLALLLGRRLMCANVGDSRAVLGSFREREGGSVWVATPLSRDHKPDLPDEQRRILLAHGRIEPFRGRTTTEPQ